MQALSISGTEFFMIVSLRVLCKLDSKLYEFGIGEEDKILMHDLIISLALLYLKVITR